MAQGYLQKTGSLPSAQALAQSYGTSHRQMLRALHSLQELGLLTIEHGGRIEVKAANVTSKSVPVASVDAVEDVMDKLRGSIADATFRSGSALPKMAWLCSSLHSSTRTIAEACRRLQKEGLLQKIGKNWIVGAELKNPQKPMQQLGQRVIVLLCNRPEEWAEFHANLMDGFVRTFGTELDRSNVRLVPFLTGDEKCDAAFGVGKVELRKFILDLGKAYLGVLFTPLISSMPDFKPWCTWLARFGKPVVCLQDDQPDVRMDDPRIVRVSYGDWVPQQPAGAEDLALQALVDMGHKRIAFVCNRKEDLPWFRVRTERLLQKASEHSCEVIVHDLRQSEDTAMRWVRESGATALLCPNDRYAVAYWKALKILGVRVPKELSMLSFDNLAELKPYPISTIDFGLSLLGYQVFHLLLGDVPVRVSRSGQLFGVCRVIDNGSLARPHKG